MRTLYLVLVLSLVSVVSSAEPARGTVASVYDGDTIRVILAGEASETRVRLLWIDTPEVRANDHGAAMPEGIEARDALRAMLPTGTTVALLGEGHGPITKDRYGRLLAHVGTLDQDGRFVSVQGRMIAQGWSPVWRKYSDPPAPELAQWLAAERAAESEALGAWRTAPVYMRDKRNERTAPK